MSTKSKEPSPEPNIEFEVSDFSISKDSKTSLQSIKILCVMKAGGCYTPQYVNNLYRAIGRHAGSIPFEFICLSDLEWSADYKIIKLENNWDGWWPKIEMFKHAGPVLTMDLDTLIVDDITPLLELPLKCASNEIYMMKAPNPKRTFTTSIMAWNEDFTQVYDNFNYGRDIKYDWDQFYILHELEKTKTVIHPIQEEISGIYSYKRQWIGKDKTDTRIIWFHGRPRLHSVKTPYIRNNWDV